MNSLSAAGRGPALPAARGHPGRVALSEVLVHRQQELSAVHRALRFRLEKLCQFAVHLRRKSRFLRQRNQQLSISKTGCESCRPGQFSGGAPHSRGRCPSARERPSPSTSSGQAPNAAADPVRSASLGRHPPRRIGSPRHRPERGEVVARPGGEGADQSLERSVAGHRDPQVPELAEAAQLGRSRRGRAHGGIAEPARRRLVDREADVADTAAAPTVAYRLPL